MHLLIKIISITCISILLLTPNFALAHASHGEPLNNEQALLKAAEYMKMVIEKPERMASISLDESWTNAEAKMYKKNVRYYVVSLHNADQDKTLYVLIDINGEFYNANFDGSFEGI